MVKPDGRVFGRMTEAEALGREKAAGTVSLLSHALAMLTWRNEKVFKKLEEVWSARKRDSVPGHQTKRAWNVYSDNNLTTVDESYRIRQIILN